MKKTILVAAAIAATFMLPINTGAMAAQTAAPIQLAALQTGLASSNALGVAPGTSGITEVRHRGRGVRRGARRGRGIRRGRGVRRGARRGRRGRNLGVGIAAGIAGAVALGAIASANASRVSRDEYDWERCDERYNSFRWSDGTFQPYGGGPRELCSYLY